MGKLKRPCKQNGREWSADKPRLIHEVPVYNVKFGAWHTTSVTKIIRPTSFLDTINSKRYSGQILTQYFENSKNN
jgi:hypothetical protein